MANGMNGGKSSYLRPPFVWTSNKTGLVEDRSQPRWSRRILRAMRNGQHDWSKKDKN